MTWNRNIVFGVSYMKSVAAGALVLLASLLTLTSGMEDSM